MAETSRLQFNGKTFSPRQPLALACYAGTVVGLGAACSIAGSYLGFDPQTAGTLSALGAPVVGLASNLLPDALKARFIDHFRREEVLQNGELVRAVGHAICAAFIEAAPDAALGPDRAALKRLGKMPEEVWERVVAEAADEGEGYDGYSLTKGEAAAVSPDEVARIFYLPPHKSHGVAVLTPELWRSVVLQICVARKESLDARELDRVAGILHGRFADYLRNIIVKDVRHGGEAFASLVLKLFGVTISMLQEKLEQDKILSEKVLELPGQLAGQLAGYQEELRRLGAGFEAERLAGSRAFEKRVARLKKSFAEAVRNYRDRSNALGLKEELFRQVRATLYGDAGNTFFRKHVPRTIYSENREVGFKFGDFLRQTQKPCFAVIGRAGIGKTCLLCHFAELLSEHGSEFLPLLMSAGNLRLTDRRADELKLSVFGALRAALPFAGPDESFDSLGEFLKGNGLNVVVFVDGLNELHGSDSYAVFNEQFQSLLELSAARGYPLRFVLTCRYESWRYFGQSRWAADGIYLKDPAEQATVLLDPLSQKDVRELAEKYFHYFAIDGELTGEAIETCRTPLMLRFLCDAYTNRPADNKKPQPSDIETYELNEVSSLKKKEILKRYVVSRREEFTGFARSLPRGAGRADDAASDIYRLTTLYIIHIANFMYQKRRAFVTAEEVAEIAAALGHPDARLGRAGVASDSSSAFLRLTDLGIFSRDETAARETFSFVYETYFEFSLGRYFAFMRWPELTGGALDAARIKEDIERLIEEHVRLSRGGDFSNLFGAIQFAVLATEAGEWLDWAGAVPREEQIYRRRPELFTGLIQCLADTRHGFDWRQQACSIIREAEITRGETWRLLDGLGEVVDDARRQFGRLLRALDSLATTTDFVLLWDIENTVRALAQANLELTLAHLDMWAESGESLKVVFAAQVVSKLALDHPRRMIQLLQAWLRNPKFRSDFWIIRSLLFAISGITESMRGGNLEADADWRLLREEVRELVSAPGRDSATPFISSRALSLLTTLSLSQPAELRRLDALVAKLLEGEDSWQLLNLLFHLAAMPDADFGRLDDWILATLARAADSRNQHILYAVEKVLDRVEAQGLHTAAAADIRERKLRGRRWRTDVKPKVCTPERADKVGVVYTPAYLEPDYENHIECRERLLAILNALEAAGEQHFAWITPREATVRELSRAHNPECDFHRDGARWFNYVEMVRQVSESLGGNAELERGGASELRFESFEIAKLAAGGVIEGIDYVMDKSSALAACVLNRPPGHLANNTICIFNNIAVGALYALEEKELDRILVVDCDAHHGKHTQQVFYRSDRVVYFSMHIDGDYARESGTVETTGGGRGEGYTFNIPYPPGMSDEGYEYVIDNLLTPVALDFRPQLILVSAGFDGHFDDPLTPACLLSERAYIHLARRLKEIAEANGCKIVGALEGGYGLTGMANSLAHMLNVWGGWGLEEKLGFTREPELLHAHRNGWALRAVKEIVAARVALMRETKGRDPSYFFDPSGPHWRNVPARLTDDELLTRG